MWWNSYHFGWKLNEDLSIIDQIFFCKVRHSFESRHHGLFAGFQLRIHYLFDVLVDGKLFWLEGNFFSFKNVVRNSYHFDWKLKVENLRLADQISNLWPKGAQQPASRAKDLTLVPAGVLALTFFWGVFRSKCGEISYHLDENSPAEDLFDWLIKSQIFAKVSSFESRHRVFGKDTPVAVAVLVYGNFFLRGGFRHFQNVVKFPGSPQSFWMPVWTALWYTIEDWWFDDQILKNHFLQKESSFEVSLFESRHRVC